MGFDPAALRREFPILSRPVRGKPLVYLDNAATTQKPRRVIETLERYYAESNANVHRGVHFLSERATAAYEGARETVRRFLNARQAREIVFVRGTTEAVNLVAAGFGRARLQPGDEVLITALEHHSNIVPWQLACEQSGAVLKVAPIDDAGQVVPEEYAKLLSGRTRIAALAHVSNALGTVNPVKEMIALAHAAGAAVLVDGAQAVAHHRVDVQELDCDFYAFSGHKVYGPTGVGALYGKAQWLEALPPYQGGGEMIRQVSFEKTTYADPPQKFEAGTPHIAGAIGLASALDFLIDTGLGSVAAHEHDLLVYATAVMSEIPGLRIVGNAAEKSGILSFVLDGVHPHDIATVLDREGVAIRAGHHCAMPVMARYGLAATARASFALYNTRQEVDALAAAVRKARELFHG